VRDIVIFFHKTLSLYLNKYTSYWESVFLFPPSVHRRKAYSLNRFLEFCVASRQLTSLLHLLHLHLLQLKRSFQWPQDEDEKDKVVEVYIANDKSQVSLIIN